MARAILDVPGAWAEASSTPDGSFSRDSPAGNGNSRLNTMYWIATRPEAANDLPLLEGTASLIVSAAHLKGGATSTLFGLVGALVMVGLLVASSRASGKRPSEGAGEALLSEDTQMVRIESAEPVTPAKYSPTTQ
eukprot:CAMPEP_0179840660 /NCGR_PEP_ID=MMETSP0982-20121206/2057_1 /TAXON_ID=483367 /ORGANISM="non described non described, Strain CCMP 2436" /LENGTH=134 /DNA_ID=CAMNT_0021724571 /DNA_START=488 /DNA_END=892 /DNA_ORIENTATION=+